MDYEFKHIESLIREAIDSVVNSRSNFKEQFAKISTTVSEAETRARRSFLLATLSFDQPKHLTYLVQFHQQSLINFSDELTERTCSGDDPQLIEMITFFREQLEGLLKFLQSQFPEHFSLDFKVSEFLKTRSIRSLKAVSDQITKNGSNTQISQALFTISLSPLHEFLRRIDSPISQRALAFITKLSGDLNEIIQLDLERSSINERVLLIFVALNYNSKACFDYFIDHLKSLFSEEDAVSSQLEKLAFSYKMINQTQVRRGVAYDFQSRALKDQLSDWLVEEIRYLERMKELSVLKEAEFMKTEFKLEFNMSVSQFAYFVKAFVESGVIQNKNTSELMRFLSKFVKSRRSESIGYESFRAKYYNVENSTKDSVKNLLHTTIGYINSN